MENGGEIIVQSAQSSGAAGPDVYVRLSCDHPGRPGEQNEHATHTYLLKELIM